MLDWILVRICLFTKHSITNECLVKGNPTLYGGTSIEWCKFMEMCFQFVNLLMVCRQKCLLIMHLDHHPT
jgi:hypothetical protein